MVPRSNLSDIGMGFCHGKRCARSDRSTEFPHANESPSGTATSEPAEREREVGSAVM
jgi:hypothetical protein